MVFRFSIGQLPTWAKKKVTESVSGSGGLSPTTGSPDMPKGRWAQTVGTSTISFKSHYDTDSVVPFPQQGKLALRVSRYYGELAQRNELALRGELLLLGELALHGELALRVSRYCG